jgi:hypothetical protein
MSVVVGFMVAFFGSLAGREVSYKIHESDRCPAPAPNTPTNIANNTNNAIAHFRRGKFNAMTGGTVPLESNGTHARVPQLESNGTHARMGQLESNAVFGATSTFRDLRCNKHGGAASCITNGLIVNGMVIREAEYCAHNGCLACGSFGCDCTCKVVRDGVDGWHKCPKTGCEKSGCGKQMFMRDCKDDWDCCPANHWHCGQDRKCGIFQEVWHIFACILLIF